jgi:uncharacterized protein YjbI with pentapeptide repeats
MNNNKACGKPVVDSDGCIFHSEDIEGKRNDFDAKFEEEFARQKRYEDVLNFKGYIFPNPIVFSENVITKKIYFNNAIFHDVDFNWTNFKEDAIFHKAQFKGEANFNCAMFTKDAQFESTRFTFDAKFEGAIFEGKVHFGNCEFSRDAIFYSAQFSNDAIFNNSTFTGKGEFSKVGINKDGEAQFNKAVFLHTVYFTHSTFSGRASFNKAKFNEEAAFISTIFKKGVTFSGSIFPDDANFTGASLEEADIFNVTFLGKTFFRDSKFSGDINFTGTTFSKKADFGSVEFLNEEKPSGKISFTNAVFEVDVDFFGATFSSETVDFSGAVFSGKETQFSEATFNINKISLVNAYFNNVYGLFESLERKKKYLLFFKKTEYLIKDFNFSLGSRCAARYPIIAGMIKDAWYFGRLKEKSPAVYWFMRITTNLNKSIRLFILWCAVIASVFGLVYYFAFCAHPQSFHFEIQAETQSLFTFLYYSVVTFTTLGFGDIIPVNGWLQALVIVEVTFGYLMLGFLINLLNNYIFSRRS